MSGRGSMAAWLGAAGAAALVAGCAGKPAPAPAPAPQPTVHQAPPPAPVPMPPEPGQQDAPDPPLTPGDWSYRGDNGSSEARYGDFSLRCDGARREVKVSRSGASGSLRLRTSYGERLLAPGAALPAADPLLDEMVFSRGRFTVEAPGMAALILPAWPEPARVVEDCRG